MSERLREYREEALMNQSEISRALRISRGGINRWKKRDAHKISLENSIQACDVLGATLEELPPGTIRMGVLDPGFLQKAMSLVSDIYKRIDNSDRAKLLITLESFVDFDETIGSEVVLSLVKTCATTDDLFELDHCIDRTHQNNVADIECVYCGHIGL